MLEAFHDRLCDLCADDGEGCRKSRADVIEVQTRQVRTLADEFGILKTAEVTWDELCAREPELDLSSEHLVEFSPPDGLVGKTTIPGKFGLMPAVITHLAVNLRGDPSLPATRRAIEPVAGTPLEYLQRWLDANAIFNDDVKLASVVEWADGRLSFGITQPQYNGEPAPERDIIAYFEASGWKWITDPSGDGHLLFFNYSWGVLAFDAVSRNCFLHDDALMPFDVILCRPDDEMADFLRLF